MNPDSSERVYGEIYSSDVFLEEHERIQGPGNLPNDDLGCRRERVVAALMFSSDATHLADFGNAKAWPIYMMLGNLSKYVRSTPSSGALHHLAYIPSLPDYFDEFVAGFHPSWRSQHPHIKAHCRRELFHNIWREILSDPEFLHAYQYGFVIKCIDGIERRVYPRIFTYSADYPEKVLLATIRDKGLCPCPRCLIPKTAIQDLGTTEDWNIRTTRLRTYHGASVAAARRAIYNNGRPVRGAAVDESLREFSGVPTSNAFVDCLGSQFNPSSMLTVDLLHEIELGVWKSLFTHLVRILHAASTTSEPLVVCLDERYRRIDTFGDGGIRRFSSNSSEMKKMAARDFEDLLQCAIPCFEGLLPEPHNGDIMKLLYCLAEWHALAKLRIHTDTTLKILGELTQEFGVLIRHFRDSTCVAFSTVELPRETAARQRHDAANQSSHPSTSTATSGQRRSKAFTLATVKLHFMGDYVDQIRRFGSTDSYSTQLGEQAHSTIKSLYGLTNKKNPMQQIGAKYSRNRHFRDTERKETQETRRADHIDKHHVVAPYNDCPINLFAFVRENPMDPAKRNFISKLKGHLLGRILGREFDADMHDDFTEDDRNTVRIRNNTIFRHKTICINYTTYDVRRDCSILNPRNRRYCMVAAPESDLEVNSHPFWYAAVLGIFHAEVQHTGPRSLNLGWRKMEFLWVRWLGVEPDYVSGRNVSRLPKIGFVPDSDEFAFSFLDPAHIIRGCHLIPTFSGGRTKTLLNYEGPTEARFAGDMSEDWLNYYVNIFVDRDMFMRYLGLGIGHREGGTTSSSQVHVRESGQEDDHDMERGVIEDEEEEYLTDKEAGAGHDHDDGGSVDDSDDEDHHYDAL
ncbi:hypothetical protein NP233_g4962 [Leucocoprinus birnbaumii]|uniref:Uncharacterized protein n=1 Tax=Leucocoprinus birnbaumii TaxID=56174 RepID=A0AAD5VV55_9AGAR|nr:hypothetical protein NP233_g4962 [Leucocoprinus birnbaumii]